MGVDAYREDRIAALGEFIGSVIAGIYEGIRNGVMTLPATTRRPPEDRISHGSLLRDSPTWSARTSKLTGTHVGVAGRRPL